MVLEGGRFLGGGGQPGTPPPGMGCVKGVWGASGVRYVPNSYLVRLETLYPDSQRPKRGAWWGSGASLVHFGGNYQTKVDRYTQHPVLTPNLDLEGPGVLLELWCLTFKESL